MEDKDIETPRKKRGASYSEEDDASDDDEEVLDHFEKHEDVYECAECGVALTDKKVMRKIDGEKHKFCSEECADEFEESIASE